MGQPTTVSMTPLEAVAEAAEGNAEADDDDRHQSGHEDVLDGDDAILGGRRGLGRVLVHDVQHFFRAPWVHPDPRRSGWVTITLRSDAGGEITKIDEFAESADSVH